MQLETAHSGVIEIDVAECIDFPEGIPGFEHCKKFVLLGHDSNEHPFFWLQSVDRPEYCFVVTDPFIIYNGYGVDIDDEDVNLLQITNADTVLTVAVVVVQENIKDARVNLKAPILINTEKKLGKQVIQKNDNLPIRYNLYQNQNG